MKDFPIRLLQQAALNPVGERECACVPACWCLVKLFPFTGRHSLGLLQAFPRNIGLGEGRGVFLTPLIFESKFLKEIGLGGRSKDDQDFIIKNIL